MATLSTNGRLTNPFDRHIFEEVAGEPSSALVRRALKVHERRSLKRLTIARTIVFSAIFCWLYLNYGAAIAFDNAPYIALFIANGVALYWLKERLNWGAWTLYAAVLIDVGLLALTLLAPGRTYPADWPWATVLRQPSFLYWLLVPALSTLTLRPLLVLWSGFCVAMVWAVGVAIILAEPGVTTGLPNPAVVSDRAMLDAYLDPTYVHLDDAAVRIFLTLLITIILTVSAWQGRRLVFQEAEIARQRTNLARFVAPNMVEQLAATDRPFGDDRVIVANVLFADVRDFTALAETLSPGDAMELLRSFHGLMAKQVFDHGGTLDKFIGDGLMATFGTPTPGRDDSSRALACVLAMAQAVGEFNAERHARGLTSIEVGIGLHRGPVTMGEIGSANRLEFTVIGDTVNVASRLENLTRDLGQPALISGEIVANARDEDMAVDNLICLGNHILRGRSEAIELWSFRSDVQA